MTAADGWWLAGFAIVAVAFTISLTSIPERLQALWWESDSEGEGPPPKEDKRKMPWNKEKQE